MNEDDRIERGAAFPERFERRIGEFASAGDGADLNPVQLQFAHRAIDLGAGGIGILQRHHR